ncbi:CHASE2 domain-containing protein [Nostoc sp.]|uniref:CHASE2 domain-containing protein n=1 Tax=Nostoc sp. TaxID=1180 RepID=UPI002FF4A142
MWRKGWQFKFLSLGIGCGVFYNFIFSQIPLVQKLELQLQDTLLRLHHPKSPPQEIILVKIQRKDLANQKLSIGRVFYADLVEHLLEAGASVVVLNLRNDWREPSFEYPIKITEPINRPLKNLVQNHSAQLVLVTRTNPISNYKKTNFLIYNHLIPFDGEQLRPLIPPHTLQGFFEYEPEAEFPRNLSSTARRSHLVGRFLISEENNQVKTFKSAALLALEKFEQQEQKSPLSSRLAKIPTQVEINFWGRGGTFPSLELTSICQPSKVNSGKLTLTVITELQPLQEPELNSVWIEHREEIYRFFREALNNVIQHAQPPHGTATQVCISLEQQGAKCILAIANDASIVESTIYGRKKGGYGTKMMDAIASELSDGAWEMSALPDGQVQVTLSWHLP